MRRPYEPARTRRWRHDPIGAFTGVVGGDGASVVPFTGPRDVDLAGGEALPPPGTEVAFVVVMASAPGEPRRFVARNVRRAR